MTTDPCHVFRSFSMKIFNWNYESGGNFQPHLLWLTRACRDHCVIPSLVRDEFVTLLKVNMLTGTNTVEKSPNLSFLVDFPRAWTILRKFATLVAACTIPIPA